jgi:hypothetical protein
LDKYKADRHVKETLKHLQIENRRLERFRSEVVERLGGRGMVPQTETIVPLGRIRFRKTTFIREFLLQGIDDDSIFIPTKMPNSSRFSWSQYEPKKHVVNVVMMIDEFDCNRVDTNAFKLVCEGEAMYSKGVP